MQGFELIDGRKTYLVAAAVVLVAVLYLVEAIDQDQLATLLAILGGCAAATFRHAIQKAQDVTEVMGGAAIGAALNHQPGQAEYSNATGSGELARRLRMLRRRIETGDWHPAGLSQELASVADELEAGSDRGAPGGGRSTPAGQVPGPPDPPRPDRRTEVG